jgi:cardiolipin synthase
LKLKDFELNIPNIFSLSRVVLVPLFIYLLNKRTAESLMLALIVFVLASFTDFLDGWSARKLKKESEFGKFIDPIADKLLVISALAAIIVVDPDFEVFDFWMIVIIVGRDVLITVMRYLAIKRGKPLRTSRFGKFKTGFQMVSIVLIVMIYYIRKHGILLTPKSIPYWIMVGVTLLTALSGLRYLVTNWRLFSLQGDKKTEGIETK